MKKEDLREAFDKIHPREELINATLEKTALEKAKAQPIRPINNRRFNYRVASAACAMLLLVGFVVFIGKDSMTAPTTTDDSAAYARASFNGENSQESESNERYTLSDETVAAEMLANVEKSEGEWKVLQGEIIGCRYISDSDGGIVTVQIIKVHGASDGAAENGTFEIAVKDSDMQRFSDAIGSEICFAVADGEMTDYYIFG